MTPNERKKERFEIQVHDSTEAKTGEDGFEHLK